MTKGVHADRVRIGRNGAERSHDAVLGCDRGILVMPSLVAVLPLLALLAPSPSPSPPSPKAAARAAMKAAPPTRPQPRRPEFGRLPIGFSLTGDAGFLRWSSFLSLGEDRLGRWTLEGTSLGGGLRCADFRYGGCVPLAEAILAVAWQAHGSPVALLAGPTLTSLPVGGQMRTTPGLTAGVRFTPASLAALVQRRR